MNSLSQSKNSFEFENRKFLDLYEPYKDKYFLEKKKLAKGFKVSWDFWNDLEEFMEAGKKLRGFLVYLGYLATGGKDIKKILPVSLSYEVAHSFLLMHDDVIDRSDVRRGKPTIHKKYAGDHGDHFGQSIAIVWGDIAAFESMALVCEADFENNLKLKALNYFIGTIISTGLGEGIDVVNSYLTPKESDIKAVNILKTAKYSVVGPLVCGGILAGARESQIKAMESFGLAAGEAFQLQDDLLGIFGEENVVGKSVLSDMREGKSTFLMLKTKNLASKIDKKTISKVWGNNIATLSDLKKIRQIVKSSGAYEGSLRAMTKLEKKALSEIKSAKFSDHVNGIFSDMTKFLISRGF